MNKSDILQLISNTKKEYAKMLENAHIITEELQPPYTSIPVDPKDGNFGKWFYNEGKKLSSLSNNPMECIQNIDLILKQFHTIYYTILNYYKEKRKGETFFSKLFTKSQTSQDEIDIQKYIRELNYSHEKLLTELIKMERRIQAVPEEKFILL